jgi:hypothetical protein
MLIQLHKSFITNTSMFRSPSAVVFRVYSINIRSTIEVMYDEILQDLVHCTNGIKFLRPLSNQDKIRIWMYSTHQLQPGPSTCNFNQYNGIFHDLNTLPLFIFYHGWTMILGILCHFYNVLDLGGFCHTQLLLYY